MCAFFFLWKKDFTLWTSSAEVPGGPGVTFGLTAASFLNLSTSLWKAMSRGTSRGFLGKYFFLNSLCTSFKLWSLPYSKMTKAHCSVEKGELNLKLLFGPIITDTELIKIFGATFGNTFTFHFHFLKPKKSLKISMKHKCPIESNSEQVPEPNLKAYCLHTKLLLYSSSKRSYCIMTIILIMMMMIMVIIMTMTNLIIMMMMTMMAIMI